ncbi:FUSC family protein [Wohlfahrtiimonas chitiniclastica]|uniref:FUSC family protein n=1 Tax=Wohlfahrtiimonas chitiniclastica TaxID=400946 RepID=UPI000B98050F|nr:FUSC family membrane protein [Wohlfahrtiimonas chitiniclastica]OYQ90264.1 FUSC family protein [Wohlfahrtiimonas chitiniclastica]
MNRSLTNIYRFFFSYDFTIGLYKGIGVFLPVFIVYLLGGETKNLITVGYASLTIGIADQIGSFKHKRNELLITLVGTLLITIYFAQFMGTMPFLFIISLSIVVFFSNFMSCFGPKAGTIGFTFIFIAMITGRNTYNVTEYIIDFSIGAIFYVIYALLFSKVFANYIIRQTLSSCYVHLARYLQAISECYRQNSDLEKSFANLIETQTTLIAEFQQTRDLLYRTTNKADIKIQKMAGELTLLTDVYDRMVAPFQDFTTIRQSYENSDIQIFLRDLYRKAANNLEEMSLHTLGGGEMIRRLGFKAELRALEFELEILKNTELDEAASEAYGVLAAHYRKAWVMNRQLDKVRELLLGQTEIPTLGDHFKKHISHSHWSWNIVKENLTFSSDFMRFSIRTAVAMFATLSFISLVLDQKQILAHSFWIAFTLVTLMRPGFSITRERSQARIIGTVLGCIIVGIIVSFEPSLSYIVMYIMVSIILSNALVNLDYKLCVMFVTIYVLLTLNMTDDLSGASIAIERVIDTAVAAVIAIFFTIYFLPSWEKREAPRLAERIRYHIYDVLETLEAVWIKKSVEPSEFYIKLKDTQSLIIQLSNSLTRMQKEPQKFHGDFHYYNEFMIRQQSVLSQLAILGYSLEQLHKDPSSIPEFSELIMLTKLRLDPTIPSSEKTKPFTGQELKPLIWMVEANT